uniref:Ribonuclease H protein At1g65750 family n=1 Tax=Cajanus cajan TaxID=3821 RepID=A0A151TYZ3_CAJCA|nr:Putative ribonuclease H protein At1g65750 family [Cajanus cajan]
MSNLWRDICAAWNLVKPHVHRRLGDGATIKFWFDSWVPYLIHYSNKTIIQSASSFVPIKDLHKHVKDYVNEQGEWELDHIREYIPIDTWLTTKRQQIPNEGNESDMIIWGKTMDETFTLKSAYETIVQHHFSNKEQIFKIIWRWYGPERIRVFLWRIAHNSLMTNAWRVRRGLTTNNSCQICMQGAEDSLNVLRDCSYAKEVWKKILNNHTTGKFFHDNLLV